MCACVYKIGYSVGLQWPSVDSGVGENRTAICTLESQRMRLKAEMGSSLQKPVQVHVGKLKSLQWKCKGI